MSLTISRRLSLLVVAASLVTLVMMAAEMWSMRAAMYEERKTAIQAQVETAASVVKGFADEAIGGRISQAEAQERAKTALRAIRFGAGEYVIVYSNDGVLQVHRIRENEGKNRLDTRDPNGVMITQEILAAGKRGSGFVAYSYPRQGNPDPSPKISYVLPYQPWGWVIAAGVYTDDLDAMFWQEVRASTMWGGVLIALLILSAWYLARGLVRPLRALTSSMGRLADNQLDTVVPGLERRDDFGPMARAVQVFKENALALRAAESEAGDMRTREERQRAANDAEREKAELSQGIVVSEIGSGLTQLARGDLTCRIASDFPAEYATLRADFNLALEQLQDSMSKVAGAVDGIQGGAGEISHAADDLARRTEQQAASLEQTAAALDEITATVRKTADGANHAQKAVTAAREHAGHSGEVVENAVAAMREIEKSSSQISTIIGVIDEIAFQTNLLALNAGVEAARAGDAGKGFAVVAQEVRALAQRSAEAAKEIKGLIGTSSGHVASGVRLVGETGQVLGLITEQVVSISTAVREIAASAQEQATALAEVNSAVNQMDQTTQQNAAMVEQSTAASHSLAHEAEQLARLISRFQIASANTEKARIAQPSRSAARPARIGSRASSTGNAAIKMEFAEHGWEQF
jgi:methyl-accepting chemotaxis protein